MINLSHSPLLERMRVESCGPLFMEPREEHAVFKSHSLSEPIPNLNTKSKSFHTFNCNDEADQGNYVKEFETQSIVNEPGYPSSVGFFFSDEEWSKFKQTRFGLEPYEQGNFKMATTSQKSLTPLGFSVGESERNDVNRNVLRFSGRKCESAKPLSTSREVELNNNNNINLNETNEGLVVTSTISSAEALTPSRSVKENNQDQKIVTIESVSSIAASNPVNNNDKIKTQENQILVTDPRKNDAFPGIPWKPGASGPRATCSGYSQIVDTIDSHPQPITSADCAHRHTPSHQHYAPFRAVSSVGNHNFGNLNKSVHPMNATINSDEVDSLVTFLSKFDEKVAAIWDGNVTNFDYNLGCFDGNISPPCTPMAPYYYPWSSPTVDSSNAPQSTYDLGAMQMQIGRQPELVTDSQQVAERFYQQQNSAHQLDYCQEPPHFKSSNSKKIAKAVSTKCFSQQDLHDLGNNQPLAAAHDSEYHIMKKIAVENSYEALENSLKELNHVDSSAGFKRFIPTAVMKELNDALKVSDVASNLDMKVMQEVLNNLDLDCEDELELVIASKRIKQKFVEQPQEDLLNSWRTHFATVEAIEMSGYKAQSPVSITNVPTNQHLPEYKLFDGEDADYNVFQTSRNATFPIRYKLQTENEKGIQTETEDVVPGNCGKIFPSFSIWDWDYVASESQFYQNFPKGSSDVGHLNDYESSEFQPPDWFRPDGTVASGSLEFDWSNETMVPSGHSDYCCDSGIGIDNSSQMGFYEDGLQDFDNDCEFAGASYRLEDRNFFSKPMGLGMGIHNTLEVPTHNVGQHLSVNKDKWVTSNSKSKVGRRRSKGKPCKFFMEEGRCKRGAECKFSHEIAPCKYWAEGTCLKGDLCPYPHHFFDKKLSQFGDGYGKVYHLESENDFPTLDVPGKGAQKSSRTQIPLELETPMENYCGAATSLKKRFLSYEGNDNSSNSNVQLRLPPGHPNTECISMDPQKTSVRIPSMDFTQQQHWQNSLPAFGSNQGHGYNERNWFTPLTYVKDKKKKKKN